MKRKVLAGALMWVLCITLMHIQLNVGWSEFATLQGRGRTGLVSGTLHGAQPVVDATLLEAGSVKSVIDRRYPLAEVPAAIAYLEEGRARGKVVISVETAAP